MMTSATGIFDFQQLNAIRDAHRAWCAEHSIEPSSPLGQQSAALMLEAAKSGAALPEDLVAACDAYVSKRAANVRLGAAPIDSRS